MQMIQWLSARTHSAFLIKEWSTGTITGLVSALLASILIAMFYEGLSYYSHLKNIAEKENKRSSTEENATRIFQHSRKTILHMIQVFIGYTLMLCVMTYNIWLLIAVSVGAGIGHFIVRPLVTAIFIRGKGNYYINGAPEDNTLIPRVPSTGSGCDALDDGNTVKAESYKKTETEFLKTNAELENGETTMLLDENVHKKSNNIPVRNKYKKTDDNEKSLNSTISFKTPKRLEGLLRETDSLKAIRSYKADDSDVSKVSELNESYLSRSYSLGIPKQQESQSYNKYINSQDTNDNTSTQNNNTSDTGDKQGDKYKVKYQGGSIKVINTSEVSIIERDNENADTSNLWNRHC